MDAGLDRSVMVTGGRGFIGRAAVKLLQREGYRVVSVDQSATATAESDCESTRESLCDISDASQLKRVFESERIEGIIHLAAVLPTAAQRDPLRATRVNVEGSLNLLEMAQRFRARRVVFGSSLSVYGTCGAEQIVSETDRGAPEDLYGAAKLYVERLGEAYRQRNELEFVSLRIGRVVGPGSRSTSSAWRSEIFEFLGADHPVEITVPYVGAERLLMVHVDDVARMLVTLLQSGHPEHGVYNAPCESMVVEDLKREVERLNSNISVRLGESYAKGNPRLLDAGRFQREFDFRMPGIVEQLRSAADSSRDPSLRSR
jgi:nucleoside-diphosphate-sugar epimerase